MPSLASACLSVAIVAQFCVRLSLPGPLSHTVICYVVYKLILLEVLQRLSACCSALFFQNIEETSGEHFERFDAVKDMKIFRPRPKPAPASRKISLLAMGIVTIAGFGRGKKKATQLISKGAVVLE